MQYRPVVNDFPSLHMQSFVDGMRFQVDEMDEDIEEAVQVYDELEKQNST